jgi:hypothetical protein
MLLQRKGEVIHESNLILMGVRAHRKIEIVRHW